MGTISHWAVDDEELEQPADFEILERDGDLYSALCSIEYNTGEIVSQGFSVDVLLDALEEYQEMTDSLNHVVLKVIESYNQTEERIDKLLVLTDEEDASSGILISPRKDEFMELPDDYTSLSEVGSNHKN